MSLLQREIEKTVRVQEFRRDANYLLDKSEREYIQYALKEYSKYRNVSVLMKSLLSCLNTPEKLDLLPVIRELLPKNDQKEYDSLAPYEKMAHPSAGNRKSRHVKSKQLHTVLLERTRRQPLGFSIRGGKEMGIGIYISQVDFGSKAETAGIQVGDQIIEVNGINFEWISHESAVTVIKAFDEFKIVVQSVGKLPQFNDVTGNIYIWVDPLGRPIKENGIDTNDMDTAEDMLSEDKRRIVINKQPGRPFGLKIRGGKEFKLGIFVVGIDPGSQCEEHGLRVGDQILAVNKTSFRSILHHEAAAILKNNSVLIMTIKSVGRIPKLVTSNHENQLHNINNDKKEVDEDTKFNSLPRSIQSIGSAPSDFKDRLTESPKFSRKSPVIRASSLSDKNKRGISPLARAGENASTKLVNSADESPKFEYGIGTQVMLASTVYSPIREQLLDSARKVLNKDEIDAMTRKLASYEDGGKLDVLVNFLIIILDKPDKVDLLNDIRPMIRPKDLAKFDKLVSHHEMEAIKVKRRVSDASSYEKEKLNSQKTSSPKQQKQTKLAPVNSTVPHSHSSVVASSTPSIPNSPPTAPSPPPRKDPSPFPHKGSSPPPPHKGLFPPPRKDPQVFPNTAQNYQTVLKDLESHTGVSGLRKIETISEQEKEDEEIEGAFGNPAAKQVLEKAKQLQRESVLQSRESFLAWNDNYPVRRKSSGSEESVKKEQNLKKEESEEPLPISTDSITSPGKPLSIVIEKTAFFLGLDISKDSKGNVIIEEVVEDGAAFNDGFLQPGFAILKVNGHKLTGIPLGDAEALLNENYDSDQPTIELIVSVVPA